MGYAGTTITVMLSNGDGTFQPPVTYTVPQFGLINKVIGQNLGGQWFPARLSQCHIELPVMNSLSQPPYFMTVADFNVDGKADIVVAAPTERLGGDGFALVGRDEGFQNRS